MPYQQITDNVVETKNGYSWLETCDNKGLNIQFSYIFKLIRKYINSLSLPRGLPGGVQHWSRSLQDCADPQSHSSPPSINPFPQ